MPNETGEITVNDVTVDTKKNGQDFSMAYSARG